MKFKCALFLYIIPILTITAESFADATDGKKSCSVSQKEEKQCGLYTYKVVKPLLNYIHEMKEKIDNNEILTLKKNNQINELQNKVTQLQQNVSENIHKDQLIDLYKNKDDSNSVHIKDLKSQVSDLQETINFYKKIIAELPNKCSLSIKTELNELCTIKSEPLQNQIAAYSKTIHENNEQITDLKKQINTLSLKLQKSQNLLEKTNSSHMATISLKDDIINNLNIQVKNHTNNLQATQLTLKDTIQKHNDQITQLKKQINDEAEQYEKKENQFRKQIDSSTNAIQEKETIIQNLNIQAKNDTNNLNETQGKLTLCETKLNNFEPEASSCVSFKTYSGIHQIEVPGIDKFDVLCDSKTAGPGWIVIQQRINGKEDFYRNFTTYQNGFGSFDGDFFLGLEKIHRLTRHKQYQLFIYMERFNGDSSYALYDHFAISGESDQYRLINVDGCSGTANGDYLNYHKNMEFYTFDRDNKGNCARIHHGGWWYKSCADSNLNGKYFGYAKPDNTANFWFRWDSLKKVQMLIRPKVIKKKI